MSDIAAQKILLSIGDTDIGDGSIIVSSFRGRQALSELYEYEVILETNVEGGLAPDVIDSLMINPILIRYGADYTGELHGIMRSVEMLPMYADRPTTYRATLVPKAWRTTLTRRSRVWQDMNYPDIVKAVLEEHGHEDGTNFDMGGVNGTYPTREYTVQYEESDFAFMSRLIEYHGIHYHFVQNPDCECIVFGDDNNAFEPMAGFERIPHQTRAATDAEGGVREMTRRTQPLTGKVNVRDYNWRTPTTPLREEVDCDTLTGQGVSDFFGDHFSDGSEGAALAQVRAEEMMVHREVYGGVSSIRQLRPGAKFEVHGHLSPDFDQEYLLLELEESMSGGGGESRGGSGYTSTFRAITFETAYRPERGTPWPRIEGIVNAKIDGEARSTATPIDDEGRYKVVIPYDTKAVGGGKASRWVRMAQPSAGNGYGMHFPLHIGTEVAIMHVNADPDRPIIIGAVPNTETMSPVSSNNATHSQIRTGSGLLIEFDDDC